MSGLYTHLRKQNPRTWRIFYRMNKRCKVQKEYKDVEVCDEWNFDELGQQAFINFYDDTIDGYSDELELDRIDPCGHYEKKNVRWATRKTQMNNKRWHQTDYGKKYKQAVENGLNRHTIYGRLKRGWSVEDTFSMPADKKGGPYRLRKAK